MRSYQFFSENSAVILGTEEASLTMIPSVRQQTTRSRINHHPTDYSAVMIGCNRRGNIPMTTCKIVTKGLRWGIILLVSEILFFVSFLRAFYPQKTICHNWTRINMASYSNSNFQHHTSLLTKPFNTRIKSLRATLPDEIFYWGFFFLNRAFL
jgi:hypothetical protein